MDLGRWLADCRALASPHLVTVLVGNKLDKEEDREVEYLEGSRWAQENGTLPLNLHDQNRPVDGYRITVRRGVLFIRRKRDDPLPALCTDHPLLS